MASGYDDGGGQGAPTIIHVHLTRPQSSDSPNDSSSWGFRLLATGSGVAVQSVQRGTLADICGLLAGDELLRIGGRDTAGMSLEDARIAIAHAGNDVELVVQRGPTRIWQPQVSYSNSNNVNAGQQHSAVVASATIQATHERSSSRRHHNQPGPTSYQAHRLSSLPHQPPNYNTHQQANYSGQVSYSLAMHPRQEYRPVTMFNSVPKPFYMSNVGGGGSATLDRRSNRHHHHHAHPMHQSAYEPRGYQDDQDISYDIHDVEQHSTSTGHGSRSHHHHHHHHQRVPFSPTNDANSYEEDSQQGGRKPAKTGSWIRQGVPVLPTFVPPPPPPLPPPQPIQHHHRSLSSGRLPRGPVVNASVGALGGNADSSSEPPRCMACTGFVTGVFAKVRGRPIHPECFRCTTCGTSLKNRGHFWANERLYCEVHAQQVQQQQQRNSVLY